MRWSLLVLLSGLLVTAACAEPNQAESSPLQIEAHLDKTEFKANEPVDVTVTLINTTDQPVRLGEPEADISMYHFDLKEDDGSEVKLTQWGMGVLSKRKKLFFSNRNDGIAPRQKRNVIFPLRRMFNIGEGGHFTLTLSRDIPSGTEYITPTPAGEATPSVLLIAAPLQFSVAAPSAESSAFVPLNASEAKVGARLESLLALPENPFWVDLESQNEALPSLDVKRVREETKMFDPMRHISLSDIPRLPQGEALLASIATQKRARLDLARIFDLSANREYALIVTPAQGEAHSFEFRVDDQSNVYPWWEQRYRQWQTMLKPQVSPIEEAKSPSSP